VYGSSDRAMTQVRRRSAHGNRPEATAFRRKISDGRSETPLQRLDRNWADLLQELRVLQTGVQLLTGFLLTIPFQPVFATLPTFSKVVYLLTMSASVVATGFLIAPVSLHRWLFRRHQRRATVDTAHRLAQVGMLFLGAAIAGVVQLIFDVVVGRAAGLIAAAVVSLLLLSLWVLLPLLVRGRSGRQRELVGPRPRGVLERHPGRAPRVGGDGDESRDMAGKT
jgi:hypothetical protein